jgi:membrane-bound lytic murein transglycosylase B
LDKPHEGKATPWCAYRAIFLTPEKVKQGVKFWQKHAETLATVEQQYGVPAEIIVAIIGVETQYGKNKGSYRVIDALTNLAFDYPRRSKYFCGELEEYLLLTREQSLDPLEPVGSYAGAIGQPQFMPSSYRRYGIDFSGSHHADLCNNSADAIASVANYFKAHGWKTGEPVAMRANEARAQSSSAVYKEVLEPRDKRATKLPLERRRVLATFMIFETDSAPQYWLGFHNFYVITRYNSSAYYAMAVYQLSQAILRERNK